MPSYTTDPNSGGTPYRSITSSLKEALYTPPKPPPAIPQTTLDRIRRLADLSTLQRVAYEQPQAIRTAFPQRQPIMRPPTAEERTAFPQGEDYPIQSEAEARTYAMELARHRGKAPPQTGFPEFGKIDDAIGTRSAGGYAALGAKLGINDFPGSNALRAVGNELLRPSSAAAMLVPEVRGPSVIGAAAKNALLQGATNVGLDVALGRDDPKQLALSAGLGAGLGAVLSPGVFSAVADAASRVGMRVEEYAATGQGRALIARLTDVGQRGDGGMLGGLNRVQIEDNFNRARRELEAALPYGRSADSLSGSELTEYRRLKADARRWAERLRLVSMTGERGAIGRGGYDDILEGSRARVAETEAQIKSRKTTPDVRATAREDRLVHGQKVSILDNLRQFTDTPDGEHVVMNALDDIAQQVEDDISARSLTPGQPALLRRPRGFGAAKTEQTGGRNLTPFTMEELVARKKAVQELYEELMPLIGPDVPTGAVDALPMGTGADEAPKIASYKKYRTPFGTEYSWDDGAWHASNLREVKAHAREQGAAEIAIVDSAASVQRPKRIRIPLAGAVDDLAGTGDAPRTSLPGDNLPSPPEAAPTTPKQVRFNTAGETVAEDVMPGDSGAQGDLLGSPITTGEGITTESAGPLFAQSDDMLPDNSIRETLGMDDDELLDDLVQTGDLTQEQADNLRTGGTTPAATADPAPVAGRPMRPGPIQAATGRTPPAPPAPPSPPAPSPPTPQVPRSRRSFTAPLRALDDVISEVKTSANRLKRTLTRGVNPSVRADEMGRVLTGYARQRVAGEGLSDTAVKAAITPHYNRRGQLPIKVQDGVATNVTPKTPGSSLDWHDILENPDAYDLTPAQRAFADDVWDLVQDVEEMRVAAGLTPRARTRAPGRRYVPRQVEEIRDIKLRGKSRANLGRFYDETQGGAAAGTAKGIKYKDINETLTIHVRDAYAEVSAKQLSDVVEGMSITPKVLIPNHIRVEREVAAKARRAEEVLIRDQIKKARANLARPANTPLQLANRKKDLAVLDALVAGRKGRMDAVRLRHERARNAYNAALERARKAEVVPGALWGPNQPNEISVKMWRNRLFKQGHADQLEAVFSGKAEEQHWASQVMETVGDNIRFLSAIGDFAAPLLHGFPLLATDPIRWSRATARHYQAFFDPAVQGRYARENLKTFQEMAQHGVPIGDPEFFKAIEQGNLSPGAILSLLGGPGNKARGLAQSTGRQTFGRFGSSYDMFLGAARAELWQAWRSSIPDAAERARTIRNMTGGLDTRALGVGANQRGVESMWLAFSPRLLRSTIALVGQAGQGGAAGHRARVSLGRMMGGTVMLYIASGMGLGKSKEEIETGLNPLSGKRFLSHEVNGDWIGIGGQFRALTQLIAGTAADPQAFLSKNRYENPLIVFYMGRGAPLYNLATAAIEGGTGVNADPYNEIDGFPDVMRHVGSSALPFTIQNIIEGQKPASVAASLFGARTSPATYREKGVADIKAADGDWRTAYDKVLASEGKEAADRVKGAAKRDFRKKLEPLGGVLIDGVFDEKTGLGRKPHVEFPELDAKLQADPSWQAGFQKELGIGITGQSVAATRKQFIAANEEALAVKGSLTIPEARDILGGYFDRAPVVKAYIKKYDSVRLAIWARVPELLDEAHALGVEELNEKEREVIGGQ